MTFSKWFFAAALAFTAGCSSLRPGGTQLEENQKRLVDALAHYGAALLYEESSDPDTNKALHHIEAAIDNDPDTLGLYSHAARLYLRSNQNEKASDVLQQAVRQNPENPGTRLSLALIYLGTGQREKAAKQYLAAIDLAPEKWELYRQLASVHIRGNQHKQAINVLEKALDYVPEKEAVISYCYNIGLQYVATKQISRAIPCFELIAKHDPGRKARFQEILGELHASVGNYKKAAEYLRKAAAANPDDPGPVIKLASVYGAENYGKAIELLESAAKKFENNFAVLFRLARFYSLEEMYEKSVDTFERAFRAWKQSDNQKPPPKSFYLNYGSALDLADRSRKAEAIMKECLRKYPQSDEARNFLAYTWAENNTNLDKALDYVREALKVEPENGAYVDTLGWIYYKQGKFEKARHEIENALVLMGEDPVLLDHLGDIYRRLGKTQKALSHWEKSYILDPENKKALEKLRNHGANINELKKKAAEKDKSDKQHKKR